MDSGPILILFLLLVFGAVLLFYLVGVASESSKKGRLEKTRKMQQDAAAFFDHLVRVGLKPVETRLILQKDEEAVLDEDSVLYETRSFRVYGGGGTRIGKIYLGGGVSESEQRWKQIDTGRLTLTTKRLVFDGVRENRNIRIADVLSVTPSLDTIEVSSQRRGKAVVFTVSNPMIWAPLVEQVAKGSATVESKTSASDVSPGSPKPASHGSPVVQCDAGSVTGPPHQRVIPPEEGRRFFVKPKT